MSAYEFALHLADFKRSPWHEERGDMRAALIAATMVNVNPWREQDAPPARIADFMLYGRDEAKGHEPDLNEVKSFFGG